jgi:hypothetical protein
MPRVLSFVRVTTMSVRSGLKITMALPPLPAMDHPGSGPHAVS